MEEFEEWMKKGKDASKKLKLIENALDSGDLVLDIDDSKLTYENMHNLNEVELYALNEKYKVSKISYFSLAGFTFGYFSLATYLFIKKGRSMISKLIPRHRMTIGNMMVKATYIATGGVSVFAVLGYLLAKKLNIYEEYMMSSDIKGEMIDRMLKEDEVMQKVYLLDNMKYYGMPQDMIDKAKVILEERRERMKKDKALLIYLIDDAEDLERSEIVGDSN